MTVIRQDDFIDSVADALQFISYYHPLDYIQAVHRAWEMEVNPAAKDAMAQILINSRMCAEGHRPICQDTGIVTVFLKIGMQVRWDAQLSVTEMVNEGVRRAYTHPDNVLRASILDDPAGARRNTGDNTPAVIHMEVVPGDTVDVRVAAKGGGSENKSKLAMLNPSDSIVDWVVKTCRPWVPAGVRRGCWVSASAVPRRRPRCSPRSPSWTPSTSTICAGAGRPIGSRSCAWRSWTR
jgi:fumarate hydratase class I